jgi:hypothetical protein
MVYYSCRVQPHRDGAVCAFVRVAREKKMRFGELAGRSFLAAMALGMAILASGALAQPAAQASGVASRDTVVALPAGAPIRTVNAAAMTRGQTAATPVRVVSPDTVRYPTQPLNVLYAQGLSSQRGHLLRLIYDHVGGSSVTDLIRAPSFPEGYTAADFVVGSASQAKRGDACGEVLRGYVHPVVRGSYTLWVSADAGAELWLSTSDDPEQRRLVAQVLSPTSLDQWDAYGEQRSDPVALEAGKRYYVEVIHKAATADDHVEIAWEGPGSVRQRIAAQDLSPFALGSGGILREYWASGRIADIRQLKDTLRCAAPPSGREMLGRLELAPGVGVSGDRVVGYVHPPVSGDYVFWLDGVSGSEFCVSSDERTARVNLCASGAGHGEVAGEPVSLVGGRGYAVTLVRVGAAVDAPCRVLWRIPGRDKAVVEGKYLSPAPE